MGEQELLIALLAYVLAPLWLIAGGCDWLAHRLTRIQETSGPTESLFHLAMYAQIGLAVLIGLLFSINALVLILLVLLVAAHQLTALWDTTYSSPRRYVSPVEQQMHGLMEVLPLVAVLIVATLHVEQLFALVGRGATEPDFGLRLRSGILWPAYLWWLGAGFAAGLLLICEELWRSLRARPDVRD